MKSFLVTVKKSYVSRDDSDDVLTFFGTIEIAAADQRAAEAQVRKEMNSWTKPLQTVDPRIRWNEECNPEVLDDNNYEYLDWSFRLVTAQPEE